MSGGAQAAGASPERGRLRRWLHGAVFDNLGLKFLSMVLALTVFLLVKDDEHREITVRVGVAYVLPEDKVLISDRIDEVRVTIRGPWRTLRHFDERELNRINIDLRNVPSGEVAFTPEMIRAPAGLTVVGISPRTMRVAFDKRTEKLVEVSPTIVGQPLHGYVVREITPAPATVQVRGGERVLAALSFVRTREVSLDGRTTSFSVTTQLVPPSGTELAGGEQVVVQVHVEEELVTHALPDVAVHVIGDGVDAGRWTVTPAQVEITYTGALRAVEKAKQVSRPVVRVLPADRSARDGTVAIEGLPPGVGVRIAPERVRLAPGR